ncbi:MAG: glycosyltransferase [Prevotella sp.]|nr:glycosyltransferase [Prevotella sp.]
MKVLIVNTSERTGGAAVAAGRLCEALMNDGVKARMLVAHKQTKALYVAEVGTWWRKKWNFVYERLVIWLRNGLNRQNLFKVSIANTGTDITRTPEFQEADIIHLHWTNQGMLSRRDIRKILQSGKPVVWTMHDMWACTAICHHAYECHRYESECGECPFLRGKGEHDLSYRVFHRKQQMLSEAQGKLTFVCVSKWLAERARKSALTGGFPVEVIPNAISLSRFKMTDRTDARTALDIAEPWVITYGAARIDDPIKGFSYLVEALRLLTQQGDIKGKDIRLMLFGDIRQPELLLSLPVSYTHLGYVDDDDQLSLLYSASNATVSSSLYETFGQTLIEAMACGSVPVSFDGSGQADIIDHLRTGYLAKRLSAQSLADGLRWALTCGIERQDLRRSVARRYTENVVTRRYEELYERMRNEK